MESAVPWLSAVPVQEPCPSRRYIFRDTHSTVKQTYKNNDAHAHLVPGSGPFKMPLYRTLPRNLSSGRDALADVFWGARCIQTLDAGAQRRTADRKDACSAGSLHLVAWPQAGSSGGSSGTPGRLETSARAVVMTILMCFASSSFGVYRLSARPGTSTPASSDGPQ